MTDRRRVTIKGASCKAAGPWRNWFTRSFAAAAGKSRARHVGGVERRAPGDADQADHVVSSGIRHAAAEARESFKRGDQDRGWTVEGRPERQPVQPDPEGD